MSYVRKIFSRACRPTTVSGTPSTTLTVDNAPALPTPPFYMVYGYSAEGIFAPTGGNPTVPSLEILKVNSKSLTTLSVTRGVLGTTYTTPYAMMGYLLFIEVFIVPARVHDLHISCVGSGGGGGGGGAARSSVAGANGTAGNGGAYAERWVGVNPGDRIIIFNGNGGLAGDGAASSAVIPGVTGGDGQPTVIYNLDDARGNGAAYPLLQTAFSIVQGEPGTGGLGGGSGGDSPTVPGSHITVNPGGRVGVHFASTSKGGGGNSGFAESVGGGINLLGAGGDGTYGAGGAAGYRGGAPSSAGLAGGLGGNGATSICYFAS